MSVYFNPDLMWQYFSTLVVYGGGLNYCRGRGGSGGGAHVGEPSEGSLEGGGVEG